ncbi:hypothetical protein [Chryseobacterium flavum]|uniref:hypothetical protein n=1 Tax=Chryseobacterium flavum TaxID=415851 RepID=UPI0028ADF1D8|nr:hypothetical protein [Chryseobacterium flavum]
MENSTNIPQEDQASKLSSTEFYTEMEALLNKAPDGMVYVINICEDQEKPNPDGRSLVALKGSVAKISFAFHVAFCEDERFRNVVTTAIDFTNFNLRKNSQAPRPSLDIPSMLAEILRK